MKTGHAMPLATALFLALFIDAVCAEPANFSTTFPAVAHAKPAISDRITGSDISYLGTLFKYGNLVSRNSGLVGMAGLSASPDAIPGGVRKPGSLGKHALRLEIITVGAFPIMLFYTDLGFGIGRYFASGLDARYAPWPFRNSESILPDDSERLARIAVAGGFSVAIAVFDLVTSLHAEAQADYRSELDSFTPAK